MKGYNNPLVTYDEIVDAIEAIIDCSLNNVYLDDFNYLNVKYETGIKDPVSDNNDEYLQRAIKELKESVDSSSRLIRSTLEQQIINEEKKLTINCDYLFGSEKRKLACPNGIIEKLKKASLDIETLYVTPGEDFEYNKYEGKDTNSVLSDFERNVILNFPEYFKEEIDIADDETEDVEAFDANELFNTMELSHLLDKIREINITTNPVSEIKQDKELVNEVKIIKEEIKNEEKKEETKVEEPKIELIDTKLYNKLSLINRALKKAKEKGNTKIVSYLEKELAKELNK